MHVELALLAGLDQLLYITLEQAELDQTFGENTGRDFMRLANRLANFQRLDRRLVGRQHDLVDRALRLAEFAADRERARDVGGVTVEFAAGVDQDRKSTRLNSSH